MHCKLLPVMRLTIFCHHSGHRADICNLYYLSICYYWPIHLPSSCTDRWLFNQCPRRIASYRLSYRPFHTASDKATWSNSFSMEGWRLPATVTVGDRVQACHATSSFKMSSEFREQQPTGVKNVSASGAHITISNAGKTGLSSRAISQFKKIGLLPHTWKKLCVEKKLLAILVSLIHTLIIHVVNYMIIINRTHSYTFCVIQILSFTV